MIVPDHTITLLTSPLPSATTTIVRRQTPLGFFPHICSYPKVGYFFLVLSCVTFHLLMIDNEDDG